MKKQIKIEKKKKSRAREEFEKPSKVSPQLDKKIKEADKNSVDGFQQTFKKKGNGKVKLAEVLTPKDYWQTKGANKATILTHNAVKKLANLAGIKHTYSNQILTQPTAYNNYQYTWQVEIEDYKGNKATGIGESNRSNLNNRGRNNPANMAEKRAYDRAVFNLLGIVGLLSEEELQEEDKKQDKMDGLTHEERKQIAPLVNQLMLCKLKNHFDAFNRIMKPKVKDLSGASLDYLRKLYKKRLAEIQKTKF